MFTGLVEDVGKVVRIGSAGGAARLSVSSAIPSDEVKIGDSIAVNGVCLTVVARSGSGFSFDVSPETVSATGVLSLKPGDAVNLERALRLSDRLGGHLVAGHVDAVAVVADRREQSGNLILSFRIEDKDPLRYLVPKGSVAIDGVSLTINEVRGDIFTVNLIPHSASATTLSAKKRGDRVNIETDILARYVERLLKREEGGGLTLDSLARNGFL